MNFYHPSFHLFYLFLPPVVSPFALCLFALCPFVAGLSAVDLFYPCSVDPYFADLSSVRPSYPVCLFDLCSADPCFVDLSFDRPFYPGCSCPGFASAPVSSSLPVFSSPFRSCIS